MQRFVIEDSVDYPTLDGLYLMQTYNQYKRKHYTSIFTTLSGLKQKINHSRHSKRNAHLWVNIDEEWVAFTPDELLSTKGRGELMEVILKRKLAGVDLPYV